MYFEVLGHHRSLQSLHREATITLLRRCSSDPYNSPAFPLIRYRIPFSGQGSLLLEDASDGTETKEELSVGSGECSSIHFKFSSLGEELLQQADVDEQDASDGTKREEEASVEWGGGLKHSLRVSLWQWQSLGELYYKPM
ncbi:hypothetical protein L1049_017570 [Liquidambar formosana]|uniref:Uncharacterized protein n=1 Tax=Liquidambar formosana TaxID=63359 RepID=A0AAP0S106_LIQFO